MKADVIAGDCLTVMPTLDAESVDAIVCDPPYGLGFMGKAWDHGVPGVEFWREALRVAKPGALLVAFGGTRTYHRLTCAIEDAGWEIRDCLSWLYGSGFPKSLDVSKAIDKAAGAERSEVVGRYQPPNGKAWNLANDTARPEVGPIGHTSRAESLSITAPATDAAREWAGWGTALKPAWEPIILARKPLVGTVAANVQAHGTGALNIDGCRIEGEKGVPASLSNAGGLGWRTGGDMDSKAEQNGRWPANVCLDEDAAALLDAQSGERPSTGTPDRTAKPCKVTPKPGMFESFGDAQGPLYGDAGGASRFFYTAKASRAERNAGLDGMPEVAHRRYGEQGQGPTPQQTPRREQRAANHHPTVKPLALMQWLCRLVTPKGGLILDPFCGSGTTGRAALAEGFRFIGIELSDEYATIARARIAEYAPLFSDGAA